MAKTDLTKLPRAHEAELARLEEALFFARHTIVDLAPPPYDELLKSYRRDQSVEDARDWLEQAVEELLERVEKTLDPGWRVIKVDMTKNWVDAMHPPSPRLPCPVCRGTPQYAGSIGYTFPEGLRRHLLGEYNARMCPFTEAAEALCQDTIRLARGKAAVDPGVVHWDKVKE